MRFTKKFEDLFFKSTQPFIFMLISLVILSISTQGQEDFIVSSETTNAAIVLDSLEKSPVRLAAEDLVSDIKKITGRSLKITDKVPSDSPAIIIRTIPNGKWEEYTIETVNNKRLEITGSDPRGTMFGIYDFLDSWLGVDPLGYWKDSIPTPKDQITFPSFKYHNSGPTVQYRGWFINDEDLLTQWQNGGGARDIEYNFYHQVVHPDVMEHIVESLVRCRYNLIIPASFLDIMNPAEEKLVQTAARRGIFISQHHVEPLGVSAFSFFNYWKKKNGSRPTFSWYSSKEQLLEVWDQYAKKWAQYPNIIWQIGLRGIADRPMWMADPGIPQSDADRGAIITDAMKTQADLIRKYDSRKSPPMTATLWMEGSMMAEKGFVVPPKGTILVFADNSPGWKMQRDFYSVPRKNDYGYGIYYHHQLWGSGPHLAQGISPKRTWFVLHEAIEHKATDFIIANVSNIREFVLGIDATSKMLWDLDQFNPDSFLTSWTKRYYGKKGPEIRQLYDLYFSSFAIHPDTKTPLLLDGQLVSAGKGLIRFMSHNKDQFLKRPKKELISIDPDPFDLKQTSGPVLPDQTFLSKDQTEKKSEEKRITSVLLIDMHPPKLPFKKILYAARYQREHFDTVISGAQRYSSNLDQSEWNLLQTNLIAPSLIMSALSGWYENLLNARIALSSNDQDKIDYYLALSLKHLKKMDHAKEILNSGNKWKYWYRGEVKLNLSLLPQVTETLKQEFEKERKSNSERSTK